MVYGWVRQLKNEAGEAFRGNGKLTAQDDELRRVNVRRFARDRTSVLFDMNNSLTRPHEFSRVLSLTHHRHRGLM